MSAAACTRRWCCDADCAVFGADCAVFSSCEFHSSGSVGVWACVQLRSTAQRSAFYLVFVGHSPTLCFPPHPHSIPRLLACATHPHRLTGPDSQPSHMQRIPTAPPIVRNARPSLNSLELHSFPCRANEAPTCVQPRSGADPLSSAAAPLHSYPGVRDTADRARGCARRRRLPRPTSAG